MPNIRTYEGPSLGLQPTETGIDAATQTARRAGAFFNQAAEADQASGRKYEQSIEAAGNVGVKYLEHRDISAGSLAHAQTMYALTQEWNDTIKNSDGNDPSVRQKFMEQRLEPVLAKFQEGFLTEKGQTWAEHQVNTLRNHFVEKTGHDMAITAAHTAKANLEKSVNTLAGTAAADPTALPMLLDTWEHNIKDQVDSSPTLTPEVSAALKENLSQGGKEAIVRAGLTAAIHADPESGLRMAQDKRYAQYIKPNEIDQLYRTAKRDAKTDYLLGKQAEAERLKASSEHIRTEVLNNIYSDDPNKTRMTTADIVKIPEDQMDSHTREHLLTMLDNKANKREVPPAVSQSNTIDALVAMRRGAPMDMQQITDMLDQRKISYSDSQILERELYSRRNPQEQALTERRKEFMAQYHLIVNPKDPYTGQFYEENLRRVLSLEQTARQKEQELKTQGIDPMEIYNPGSKYYLGNAPQARGPSPLELRQQSKQYQDEAAGKAQHKDVLQQQPEKAKRVQLKDGSFAELGPDGQYYREKK